jgi:hypothetical protein
VDQISNKTARLATLDELIANVFPSFITPVPTRDTIRNWLDRAKVARFKSNPVAKRGGGPCFYSVAGVEKLLRSRTMPPKMGGAA